MDFRFLCRPCTTALLLPVLLGLVAGCGDSGPKLYPVSGRVTIDGEPLTYGYIRFIPTEGRSSDAQLASDGTFTLRYLGGKEGAVAGTHRVEIAANEVLSTTRIKWHAPKHYASIGTSQLTEEVTGPTEDLVIDLTWGSQKGPFEDNYSESSSF